MGHEPRNRAERRAALRKARRVAGAAMAASGAAFSSTAAVLHTTAAPAGAATNFLVTITADEDDANATDCDPGDNDCSLREALIQADATAGADTVTFDTAGVFATPQTITLSLGEMRIEDDLVITGTGATNLTIDANFNSRIFYIRNNPSDIAVTISGLTLINGDSAGNLREGGAIVDFGADLTLIDTVVTNNQATNGGGVAARDFYFQPTVSLQGTTSIAGNQARYFGAPYYVGGNGGGLYIIGGALEVLDDAEVRSNGADRSGGGAWVAGQVTLDDNASFYNNLTSEDDGGGLFLDNGGLTVQGNATFADNDADDDGGGIYVRDNSSPITITGATFESNSGEDGGGISFNDTDDTVAIASTTFVDNDALYRGGGIFLNDTDDGGVTISASVFFLNDAGENGGGIYLQDPDDDVVITNTTIAGNSADQDGGGIYLYYTQSELQIFNTTIANNVAGDQGGGIEIDYYDGTNVVSVFNSTISGNTAAVGGGIDVEQDAQLYLVQTTVTNNASSGDTGGIYLEHLGPLSTAGATEKDRNQARKAADATDAQQRAERRDAAVEAAEPRLKANAAAPDELKLIGTIVSANDGFDIGGGDASYDNAITSDHSLIGNVVAHGVINDLGGTIRSTNPGLGPLADNGGPTATHELLAASAAIDAGPTTVTTFTGNEYDQRGPGFARVINGRVDIGAFEAPLRFADFTG